MKFDPDDSWLHKTDINMKVDWKEKYEKERIQFAEQELKRLKKTLVDPVDEARKAGL